MSLLSALTALRVELDASELPFTIEGSAEAQQTRRELIDQLDDYLLPRLSRLDAPLLAVLGGSTGAGKSTITNSLVGEEVSTPGVLRPTTRTPVLVCHPSDVAWFQEGGVLPDLPRSTGDRPTGAGLHIVTAVNLAPGLAILDSPDIDSVETANHDLAGQLLGAADLWLFVTTAARYADAVPWEYLARARERSIALSLIVNRLPTGAADEVLPHLAEMLDRHGLTNTTVFAIAETPLVDARIGDEIEPVRSWLAQLASNSESRNQMVRASVDGVLDSLEPRVDRVADALVDQARVSEALRALSVTRYDDALSRVDQHLASGHVLRGEVLGQWQEIVGTGEFMGMLQQGVTRVRDGIKSIFTGKKADDAALRGELKGNIAIVVREAADKAALETVEGWETLPGGAEALAAAERGIDRSSAELLAKLEVEAEAWQHGVFELVRELAGPKLNLARSLTFGINSVGVAAMIAVFSSTGGITGGEAAVAGGTAAVSQAILSAIFGEQAIRDLVELSRGDLHRRIELLLSDEQRRFDLLLAASQREVADEERPSSTPDLAGDPLRQAVAAVAGQRT